MDVFHAVGHATGIGQFLHQRFYLLRTLGNLLDEFDVSCRQLVGLLGIEEG